MRKLWIAVGAVVLVGGLFGANLYRVRQASARAVDVDTVTVQPADLAESVLTPAALDVLQEVEVRAAVSGPSLALTVQPGDTVQQGQVLARIDTSDLMEAVRQAESNAAQAEATAARMHRDAEVSPQQAAARLRAVELALEQAQLALDRTRVRLRDQELTTGTRIAGARSRVDSVKAQVAAGQADPDDLVAALGDLEAAHSSLADLAPDRNLDLREATLRVDSARQELERARVESQATALLPEQVAAADAARTAAAAGLREARQRLEQAQVRAPLTGTVLAVPVKEGQPIQRGQLVAALARTDRLVARLDVDETQIIKVQPGQTVTITSPAHPGVTFTGQVVRIIPNGTQQSQGNATTYEVQAELQNGEGKLRAGMNVDAEVAVATHSAALAVPFPAVLTDGPTSYVWVVENGVAHRRTVTVGINVEQDVEITTGLKAGDVVITGPAETMPELKEGQPVHPRAAVEGAKAP